MVIGLGLGPFAIWILLLEDESKTMTTSVGAKSGGFICIKLDTQLSDVLLLFEMLGYELIIENHSLY